MHLVQWLSGNKHMNCWSHSSPLWHGILISACSIPVTTATLRWVRRVTEKKACFYMISKWREGCGNVFPNVTHMIYRELVLSEQLVGHVTTHEKLRFWRLTGQSCLLCEYLPNWIWSIQFTTVLLTLLFKMTIKTIHVLTFNGEKSCHTRTSRASEENIKVGKWKVVSFVQRGKKRKPSQLMTWKVFEKKSMCAKVKTNCQNET